MNRNQKGCTTPSAVRANLDDPPIHIRPIIPASAGAKDKTPLGSGHYGSPSIALRIRPIIPASAGAKDKNPVGSGHYGSPSIALRIRPIIPASAGAKDKNPVGSGHYGSPSIALRLLNRNGFLCRKCQVSGCKGLSRMNRNQKG